MASEMGRRYDLSGCYAAAQMPGAAVVWWAGALAFRSTLWVGTSGRRGTLGLHPPDSVVESVKRCIQYAMMGGAEVRLPDLPGQERQALGRDFGPESAALGRGRR